MSATSTPQRARSLNETCGRRSVHLGRYQLIIAIIAGVAASMLSQDGAGFVSAQPTSVSVRLVHVSPGTAPIDASLEGQPIADGVAYGSASSRIPWPGGTARLRVTTVNESSRTLLDTPVELSLDGPSTILLTGLASGSPSLSALVLADDLGYTPPDRSRLRFVNAAPGAGAVTLISGDRATLFDAIGYGMMGDAVLDPGPITLRALPSGQGGMPIAEKQLTADPGRSATVVLAGQTGSDHSRSLLIFDHSRAAVSRPAPGDPGAPGTVLVDETFADPASGLLPATAPATASLIYGYVDDEYSLRNLEVATQSLAVPVDATNATIAVDARLIGDTTRRTVSVGCRFGSDTTGNRGYRLRVEPGAGVFRLVREDGTRDVFLRRDRVSPAIHRGNERNRLEITCAGNTITAAINGTVVTTVLDSTYGSGSLVIGVGARASGLTSEARFDNLVVTAR
ncbi:MAG: DUF4397 domain-containing protein [Dehalococcoidia bacterium]